MPCQIVSPLNYTGGKSKLLDQILPYFPSEIDTFVDLFCGGCNVGLNVEAKKYILNDKNKMLIGLLKVMKAENSFSEKVEKLIIKYNLSQSSNKGYKHYGCNSQDGLGKYNKAQYNNLREDFNKKLFDKNDCYIALFVLILYSFNNQIRFNSKGEFNLPVGKRDFNKKQKEKTSKYIESLRNKKITFSEKDFRKIHINSKSFVYCDPPYLITTATYNENNGWNEKDENDLLSFLSALDEQNIKFALSNVLEHNGKKNIILSDWINKNGYNCYHLNKSYKNSSYNKKDKGQSDEVLITNY